MPSSAPERWDFLHDLDESARNAVIAGWLNATGKDGTVLDVGCGEAVLLRYLRAPALKAYVGVDISQAALDAATLYPHHCTLIASKLEDFTPEPGKFDAIVFNEILYCAEDIAAVLEQYRAGLADGGVIAISMYVPDKHGGAADRFQEMQAVIEGSSLGDRGLARNPQPRQGCPLAVTPGAPRLTGKRARQSTASARPHGCRQRPGTLQETHRTLRRDQDGA